MARRIETDTVIGLRDHLADKCAQLLVRFVESDADYFPYRGAELKRLRERLDDLKNNRDVLVYRFELGEYAPPREDQTVFTLRGDRLVAAEYEQQVVPSW